MSAGGPTTTGTDLRRAALFSANGDIAENIQIYLMGVSVFYAVRVFTAHIGSFSILILCDFANPSFGSTSLHLAVREAGGSKH